jgi:predicted NACHT family NTPase
VTLINLHSLISAITGIANPIIKEKLQRNETVIKLLKQFSLDPEHPPADFSGVYAYTLVEYGVGKPKPFLELFRQEEIKQAFRKALDHNNPSILLSEVDVFLDTYALGDEIKTLGINIRREVAAFATVFIEVAKRSRTPADVLMNQQIGSLHKRIASIQEQLERLPTLEGMRTEMARLAAQSVETSNGTSLNEKKCKAIALAQQMQGWFETLGYRFEKYEVWEDNYFEWIIDIPARRNRYDRILVRGIEGEAGLSDVMALRQSVEAQTTDEGWLVTARRISRAARDEVEKPENRQLDCYTFDELIDQDADFSDYLDWLEAEVKRREIDKKYVPLACTKEEFDSLSKRRIGVSRYDERDGWIDGYLDVWLDDPAKEHISILGEFGTGKTWFAFHYAWIALQRYRDAQKRGVERPRLPLIITLRDYAKALNVENVLAGFFFTQHNIRLNSEVFDQLNSMGKLLLIFDGFDEMAAKCDRQQMINNFWELAKVVVPGAKVILTCRTEHFPEAKEGRALLNAELQASTANLTGETPQFEVLELEKFNDEQIRQVLSFQAESTTVDHVMHNPQLLDLARRPVMTELILEALPDIEAGKPVDMSRVYLYAVRRKMERDIKAERTFTSLADKLYFLSELSWEMLSTDQMSLNYRLFPDRIRRLFGDVVQEEKDLDHWHYDMMGQTMLIRNADGDYTPAHRSLLEFFVAYKFAAQLGALADDLIELAQGQSHINNDAAAVDYTWSSYFRRQVDQTGKILPSPPLRRFAGESLEKLRESFGRSPLTKAVMDLLLPMIDVDTQKSVINVIQGTKGRNENEVGYVGGNAATLLVKVDKGALEGKNLSHAVIKSADFSNASLRDVNFAEANLTDSVFTKFLGSVASVRFSPDGKFLATAERDGMVRLWETSSGRELVTFKGHNHWVLSVAFSPKGQTLISSGDDQKVKLWDVNTGEYLKTFQEHTTSVSSVAFCPDGSMVATGSSQVKLWDINTGKCLKILQGHNDRVRSVAFSAEGRMLATGSSDQTVRLWDISTGECLKTLQGHTNLVLSVAFNPSGKILASGSSDQTIKLWDVTTGKCLKTLDGHNDWVRSVAFSAEGRMLASGSSDQTIKLWDLHTGECLRTLLGHTAWVCSIALNPEDNTLASGSSDQTVRLWNLHTGECLKTLLGYSDWVNSLAFNPFGFTLVSGSYDQSVRLWDIRTGKCLITLQGHTGFVLCVAFTPSGYILASGSSDKTVKLWDINTGECLKTLQGHEDWINSVACNPDGKILACGSGDQTVKLWDIVTGECLKTLRGHRKQVFSVAISPCGEILASGSGDGTVRLWDVGTGECLSILQGHTDSVYSIAFTPDGYTLASGSEDQTVKLWNIRIGKCLKTLQHSHRVRSVVFTPDSRTLVSGSDDQTLKIWDVQTGNCLKTLLEHTNAVCSVAFDGESQIIASGSRDGTIKFWDFETGECLKTLRSAKPCENMNITGVKGLTDAEKTTLKALGAVEEAEM